jgi:hypothetical protein
MITLFLLSVSCFIAALTLTLKLNDHVRTDDTKGYTNNGAMDCGAFRPDSRAYSLCLPSYNK